MTRPFSVLLAGALALGAVGCGGSTPSASEEEPTTSAASAAELDPPEVVPAVRHPRLAAVDEWAYFINDPDLQALARSAVDLVVVDFSRDGQVQFSAADIQALKDTGHIVLAYLSIGEAESYRFYWEMQAGVPASADWSVHPPAWLGPENADWEGNFKVRYWDPSWQQIIVHNPGGHRVLGDRLSYLDRILDQGFDGVYLDIIDGWEFWGAAADGGNGEQPQSARWMARFVEDLAAYARGTDPDFIVCPQNGAAIISGDIDQPLSAEERQVYLATIDAIGAEDSFYFGDHDEDNAWNPQLETIALLDEFRAEGVLVLAIDYLTRRASIDRFYASATDRGWIPCATVRALDRLPSDPDDASE